MKGRRLALAAAFVLAAFLSASSANAQPSSTDAKADALFREGTRLLEEGKFALACDKLAESRSLSAGLGVTLYLADCYENLGKPREALELFRTAAALAHARKDKREQLAEGRAAKLAANMPAIVLTVTNPTNLTVAVDGTDLASESWKDPVYVDPGKHVVRATAPARVPFESRVEVPSTLGARVAVTIPLLDADAHPKPPQSWPSKWQVAGIGAAGLGVVAIGVGSVFGLVASSKLDDSNANGHCVNDRCDATGLALRSDGLDAARIADIGFVVGAVAIVAGAVIYLLAPR